MCGIAGVLMKHGTPDEGALRRYGRRPAPTEAPTIVAYLSPARWVSCRPAVDHRPGGRPPADGRRHRSTLVRNGEIYNFVELRQALEARGRRFATRSDSETILHAYALDGLAALPSLNGMFAFALYDAGGGS
jgi:asparagine synthase (glutamine-hydrolysing)